MNKLEKFVKAIIFSDKFQELKDSSPSVYNLTRYLAKGIEYGDLSPELEEKAKKHFLYVWKYLKLPDDASMVGPETAFMKDMQKNMQEIKSLMNDLRRSHTIGESKKITKKQFAQLVETIVAEMCDEDLNEGIEEESALEMVCSAAKIRMPSALKDAMEQLSNEDPYAYKSLFKVAQAAMKNTLDKRTWQYICIKAERLKKSKEIKGDLVESELSPDPEWETIQGAPMHQHYPGTFESDGSRPDLREGTNIRWDNTLYKAALSANQTEEIVESLISVSNGLNENQLLSLKGIHDKAKHLAKLLEMMKHWKV